MLFPSLKNIHNLHFPHFHHMLLSFYVEGLIFISLLITTAIEAAAILQRTYNLQFNTEVPFIWVKDELGSFAY